MKTLLIAALKGGPMKAWLMNYWIKAMSYEQVRDIVHTNHPDMYVSYMPKKAPIRPLKEKKRKGGI